MSQEQLAKNYLSQFPIPKAPPAMTIEVLNAGAWGMLPVLMNVSRAQAFDRATVRPGTR